MIEKEDNSIKHDISAETKSTFIRYNKQHYKNTNWIHTDLFFLCFLHFHICICFLSLSIVIIILWFTNCNVTDISI